MSTAESRILVRIFVFSLLIKLLIGALMPLSTDEAYYWVWSHHPQLSYYDHPPFVAWLMTLGQPFEGFLSFVRLPAILIGQITFGLWLQMLKDKFNAKQLIFFSLMYLLLPLTGPGSLIVTPDLPLLFFWTLSFFIFTRWLKTPTWNLVMALGLCLGLGFLSKYNMVLFFIFALIAVFTEKVPYKKWLPQIPVLLLFFFLGSLPVWLWNFQNGFLSFTFQIKHGTGASNWDPEWTLTYILGQIAILTPFGVWAIARGKIRPQLRVFYIFALGPLLFFLITSFKGRVEANWPLVAYPFLLCLWVEASNNWKMAKAALVIWIAALLFVLSDIIYPWVPLNPDQEFKTRELRAYRELLDTVKHNQPIYARTYQMASKLNYDSQLPVYKLKGMNRIDFYDFREESTPTTSPFFVITKTNENLPAQILESCVIESRTALSENWDLLKVIKK